MNLSDRLLARRYAKAFMAGADPAAAGERLAVLRGARVAVSAEMGYLLNPSLSLVLKEKILSLRLPESLKNPAAVFLRVLLRAKRFALLDMVLEEAAEIVDRMNGVMRAEIEAAGPVSEDASVKIAAGIGKLTGKKAVCSVKLNPALKGGMKIRFGDMVIDASLTGKFQRLKETVGK